MPMRFFRRLGGGQSRGEPEPGSLDDLIDGMNLGFADPSSHLIGPQSPNDLANFFQSTTVAQND